jgi:membrane fusion protein (multidrug efflux system)
MQFQRSAVMTAVGLSAVALTLAACGQGKGGAGGMGAGGPTEVGYIVAQTQSVGLTSELSGRTSAFLVSEVRPQVSGVVKARLFTEGSFVRAGQSLYQIDPAIYQATVNSANAALAQAQATATARQAEGPTATRVWSRPARCPSRTMTTPRPPPADGQPPVAVQKAALDNARINLNYTRVTAPISGRIGKSTVTQGALVTANQAAALSTVQDLSTRSMST